MTTTLSPEDPRNAPPEPAIQSPEALARRSKEPRRKEAYCDLHVSQEFTTVEEWSGPNGTKTVVFRRDQKLTPYEFEVAKRHGIPIRWR